MHLLGINSASISEVGKMITRATLLIVIGVFFATLELFMDFTQKTFLLTGLLVIIMPALYFLYRALKTLSDEATKKLLEQTRKFRDLLELKRNGGENLEPVKPFVIEYLKGITEQESTVTIDGPYENVSVAQLIIEVDNLTPTGKAFIDQHFETMQMIVERRDQKAS